MQDEWNKPTRSTASSTKAKRRPSHPISDTESESDSDDSGSSSSSSEEEEEEDEEETGKDSEIQDHPSTAPLNTDTESSSDGETVIDPLQPSTSSKVVNVRVKPFRGTGHAGSTPVVQEDQELDPRIPDIEPEIQAILTPHQCHCLRSRRPPDDLTLDEILTMYKSRAKYREAKASYIAMVRDFLRNLNLLKLLPQSSIYSRPEDFIPSPPPRGLKETKRKVQSSTPVAPPPSKRVTSKTVESSLGLSSGKCSSFFTVRVMPLLIVLLVLFRPVQHNYCYAHFGHWTTFNRVIARFSH